jgi:hypothetical protein
VKDALIGRDILDDIRLLEMANEMLAGLPASQLHAALHSWINSTESPILANVLVIRL